MTQRYKQQFVTEAFLTSILQRFESDLETSAEFFKKLSCLTLLFKHIHGQLEADEGVSA